MAGNSNSENKENDEKMIYARKSSRKENPKKSTKAMKSVVDEKGTSGKKPIDELLSEVVISCGKFFCPEENCGKFFGTKNPIKKHLLSHRPQNEWPFVCLFCGKYFQVRVISHQACMKKVSCTGKSLSEGLIFASINPQHDNR